MLVFCSLHSELYVFMCEREKGEGRGEREGKGRNGEGGVKYIRKVGGSEMRRKPKWLLR